MKILKTVIGLLSSCLLLILPVFADSLNEKILNHRAAFAYYLKSTNTIPSNENYEAYARDYFTQIYNKTRNDDFAWHDAFEKIKADLNSCIDSSTDTNYILLAVADIGQFNFDKNAFEFKFNNGSFYALNSSQFNMPTVDVCMSNHEEFTLLPCKQDTARAFINKRKDIFGGVNREVYLRYHLILLPFNSKEYNVYLQQFESYRSSYKIVAKINSIDVFEDKEQKSMLGQFIRSSTK